MVPLAGNPPPAPGFSKQKKHLNFSFLKNFQNFFQIYFHSYLMLPKLFDPGKNNNSILALQDNDTKVRDRVTIYLN